jgi:hypothetical protein
MKTAHTCKANLIAAALVGALAMGSPTGVSAQSSRLDELVKQPFPENLPTKEATQTLRDELLFQRATQVYLWALPILNTMGMKEGSEKVFGAGWYPSGSNGSAPKPSSPRPIRT